MAVLITVEVKGQTREGYDGMLAVLGEPLRQTPGFVLHTAHPTPEGWRVIEVWESKQASDEFFTKHVVPNLPSGIRPKRSVQELHKLLAR